MSNWGRLVSSFVLLLDPVTVHEHRSFTVKKPTARIRAAFFREFAPAAFDFRWCGKTTFWFSGDLTGRSPLSSPLSPVLLSIEQLSIDDGRQELEVLLDFIAADFGVASSKVDGCYKNKKKIPITNLIKGSCTNWEVKHLIAWYLGEGHLKMGHNSVLRNMFLSY